METGRVEYIYLYPSYLEVGHVGDVCIPVGSDGLEGEEGAGLPRHRRHLHRRLDVDLRLRLRLKE